MPRSRLARWIGLAVLAVTAGLIARAGLLVSARHDEELDEVVAYDPSLNDPIRVAAIRAQGARIRGLHAAKRPSEPGDWLDRHNEPGQTFAQYRAADPHPPNAQRTTLYLAPWGEFDATQSRLIADTAEFLECFYGVPVRRLNARALDGLPPYARPKHPDRGDSQLFVPYVLDALQATRPDDALAVLALTTADLTPSEGGRWVFGQASLANRVGVWSLYRQGDPHRDYSLCLLRTLKTATHETGHMLGIRHCKAFECCMNGSNSRPEADSRPLWFCSEDEMKVWWACRLDIPQRYDRLARFAAARELHAEARFWSKSSSALGINAAAPTDERSSGR